MSRIEQLALSLAPPAPVYPEGVPVDVCELFETLSLQLYARGFRKRSARDIIQQIRWDHDLKWGPGSDGRGFKCNDHWTPGLARWFLARHPECPGFFELRERVIDGYSDDE